MSSLPGRRMALIVSLAALVAAGCGSSSSSKSKSKSPPAASTPAPSTPSTPSTTATTAGRLTPSSPITDPRYRAALIKGIDLGAKGRLSPADEARLADCAIKKFQAEGVKTVAEAGAKQAQAQTFGAECATELHIKLK